MSSPSTAQPLTIARPHKVGLWIAIGVAILFIVLSIAIAKSAGSVVAG